MSIGQAIVEETCSQGPRVDEGLVFNPVVRGDAGAQSWALGIWQAVTPQDPVDGAKERVVLTATDVVEVVQVQRPDHGPSEPVVLDELGLSPDGLDVIEPGPLVALEGVGPNPSLRVVHHFESLVLDIRAYLQGGVVQVQK